MFVLEKHRGKDFAQKDWNDNPKKIHHFRRQEGKHQSFSTSGPNSLVIAPRDPTIKSMIACDVLLPDSKTVSQLGDLLEAHRGLKAWEIAQDLPPLHEWRGFKSRVVASKLAAALGDRRLSVIIDRSNWRENPDNHRAYFRALFNRFRFKASTLLVPEMEKRLTLTEPGSEIHCDLMGLIAACYGDVREFTKAHQLLDEATENCKDPSWLWVQRSITYQKEDRYEEALESVLEGRKTKPWYRPVIEVHADALINLGRDEEARDALIEASKQTDSPAIPLRLSIIFSELDEVQQTSSWLDDYERKSPLLEKSSRQWLAGRRADLCYLDGNIEDFLHFSGKTKEKSFHHRCLKFYQENKGEKGTRKRLEVDFVRQHNMTCAPATIAALARYFGKPHDHLAIAEAICYDGTPWHKERAWCEEHGFAVCEFPVTMAATKALIDANIPFSLTTQTIDSGHLQACIGYDEKLGLILLRDPTRRHYGEAILSGLQDDHPVVGLRGLAIIPTEMKDRLEGLELPGQRQYDLYHQLSCAFDEHDDDKVEIVMAAFRSELPEAPLRLHAECRLASKNSHPSVQLEFNEKLIALIPKHQTLWLQQIRILERLSRHTEARDFLSGVHRKPESDPFFDMEVGEVLCRDVRTIELGQFYLRRALRQQPGNSQAHATFASSLTVLGEREEALRFRRSATRLNRSFEPYARRYYREATYLGRENEALDYLRERARETGDLDVSPHLTLLGILSEKNSPEAPALAEDLLARFPNDGDLLLETVTLFSGWNRHEEAQRHLEQAKGKVARQTWLHVAARYWNWTGDRQKSREHWEQLIKLQPLNVTAYESVARHLAEEEDREAAVRFMREAYEAQPDYLPLLKNYVEWEEFHGPAVSVPLLEKAVALDPLDLWAVRELALELSKDDQHELAMQKAREALAFDPSDEVSHGVLGLVREAAQRKVEAAVSFRESLKLNVDYLTSFEGLLRVNGTFAERKETLEFVRQEMVRQVSEGDIVPAYREQAAGVVDPATLEKDLQFFHKERPDLWQTWCALREHYHATSQHEKELETARQMTERFPLLPRAWSELAFASRALGLTEEEVIAFEKALELSPSWDWILRELSQSLESLDRHEEALAVLDRAINAEPLAPGGYGYKADLLWKIGRRAEAIDEIKKALEISPLYSWGWSHFIEWTAREDRKVEVPTLIAELEKKRAHQWRWWSCLAEVYRDLEQPEDALAAVEKGLEKEPYEISLLDLRATLLAQLGRYPEAIEACQTAFDDGKQPVRLQGREAWVLMQSGRRAEAWDRMEVLSKREPDYYFAHNQLAYWAYNSDSWEQLKNASQRLIALNPDDSESWGYLGQAEEELENPEAALEAYTRALRASASYLFAARRKADLEMKADRLEDAETTLRRIQFHHQNSFLSADLLAIDLKRCQGKLTPEICERWDEISILAAGLEQDPFYYIDGFFEEGKQTGLYDLLLSEKARECAFRSPAEARAWGRRVRTSKRRKKLIRETLNSALKDDLKASVIAEIIRGHDHGVPKKEVEQLIKQHSPLIEKHRDSWEAALAFYTHYSEASRACLYGDLWRNFLPEVRPSSLVGYASFIDETRSLAAGHMVRKAILNEFPQWEGTKYLRVCTAFQKAMDGQTDEAEDLIAGYADRHEPQDYYDAIHRHTLAILAAQRGDAAVCEQNFRLAADHIRKFPQDVTALRYLRASADSCAKTLGVFKGNSKNLLKNWAKGLGKEESKVSWWLIAVVIWIIIQVIRAMNE